MNMKNKNTKYNNEKGQTLLFVIVAVTIAMAVGVAVSTRTIQSLKRVARTDTSARVIAAAEGGIENLLGRNYSQLDGAIGGADCGLIGAVPGPEAGACSYVFRGTDSNSNTGDLISSRAVVKVEEFSTNEENGGYSFNLVPGSVKEVNLDTYDDSFVRICWSEEPTVIYYYSYDKNGEVRKGGIYADDDSPNVHGISYIFVKAQDSYSGYNYCKEVQLVNNSSYGLRIKALYADSKVAVFPKTGHTLPPQGYKLTSRGEIVTGSGSEEKATVIVHKSLPYASDIFDYGIYTPTTLSGSN